VGLALLRHLDRLGVGVSTFAAVGEKYDVSANDLLLHWEQDTDTKLGLLHVESFGNPRKFAHTARRLSRLIPLLAVDPEQSPSQARTALYAQAGIIAVPSLGALVDAAALVAHQPLPRGSRVAVIGNTHGMVSLAVQACIKAGFEVTSAADATPEADAARLAAEITAAFTPDHEAADLPESVLLALAPTAPGPLVLDAAAEVVPLGVPVLAVLAEQPESVAARPYGAGQERVLPCYNDAAAAAAALTAARRAGRVKRLSQSRVEYPEGVDPAALRGIVAARIKHMEQAGSAEHDPDPRELTGAENDALLGALGIVSTRLGPDAHGATVTAWQDKIFGPVLFGQSELAPQPVTMLAPVDSRVAESVAARLAAGPAPALADLLRRAAALVDACPEVSSFWLSVEFDDSGVHRTEAATRLAPAESTNPYLRRLRRAPVE
jgi:hypothetical protein